MRSVVFCFLFAIPAELISAGDETYIGTWRTTNRPLDGSMTCSVKDLGNDKWTGRFYGVWQGVPFDYTVPFEGEPANLQGKAVIDGANYSWTGSLTPDSFRGSFGGTRYSGTFDLKVKPPAVASRPR